jgi:cyclic 2,3-diphosphoglycerate synthetase
MEPELVVFDGSGAALPPIDADATVVVVGGLQDPAVVAGYLNTYRLLLADLVVVTMAEADADWELVRSAARDVVRPGVEVVGTVLRPRPLVDVSGRSVAYFCAAPEAALARLAAHLSDAYGADVVHVSGHLANRDLLRKELPGVDAEVFLIELKAAAVDVVAEAALAKGASVALAANDVVPADGDADLDEMLLEVAKFGS